VFPSTALCHITSIAYNQYTDIYSLYLLNKYIYVQRTEALGSLCALLGPFCGHAELVLMIARITAKLSLLDPFRSQINSRQEHVRALASIIVRESETCKRIMDGDGGDNGGEGKDGTTEDAEPEEWPAWHTWPLLSRVSFTLGNLTTSNDTNRQFIGVQVGLRFYRGGSYRGGLSLYTSGALFMWSGVIDSPSVLLSYPITSLASPMTNILISALF